MAIDTLLARIRAEYLEMPGLRLTLEQAQRLSGAERALCQHVLDALVHAQFLRLNVDGTYVRMTEGTNHPRPRPAKAHLNDRLLDSRERPA